MSMLNAEPALNDDVTEMFREAHQAAYAGMPRIDDDTLLIMVLAAQRNGKTCLPHRLGLQQHNYYRLGKVLSSVKLARSYLDQTVPDEDLRQSLLDLRLSEWQDIRELLLKNRKGENDSELLWAEIVAAGCMGGDHLWRDLGLVSRDALRFLLANNFPELAAKNSQDMKWKKFLYKQLCEQDGAYVCRAPTCEQCAAYHDCFGPEA